MAVNAPGCMCDRLVADYGKIYGKLHFLFKPYSIKCAVDSAFLAKKAEHKIKISQSLTESKTKYDACKG